MGKRRRSTKFCYEEELLVTICCLETRGTRTLGEPAPPRLVFLSPLAPPAMASISGLPVLFGDAATSSFGGPRLTFFRPLPPFAPAMASSNGLPVGLGVSSSSGLGVAFLSWGLWRQQSQLTGLVPIVAFNGSHAQ